MLRRFRGPRASVPKKPPTKEPSDEDPKSTTSPKRLPSIPWTPNMEFKKPNEWQRALTSLEITQRILTKTINKMFTQQTKIILGSSFTGVFALSTYEAALMCTDPWSVVPLLLNYAATNFFPSMIWDTVHIEKVAAAMGYDPAAVLVQFGPDQAQEQAQMWVQTHSMKVKRSILASFMTLAQLLRMVQIGIQATALHKESVLSGREPPTSALLTERFFRIGGSASDVTELSIRRYGSSMLPVYAEESSTRVALCNEFSQGGYVPVMWTMPNSNYSLLRNWEALFQDPGAEWFLRTKKGEKVLYIEADATNVDKALALGHTGYKSNDLTIAEASQTFRVLEMLANTKLHAKPDKVVRVFLADTTQEVQTGGEHHLDLDEYIQQTQEADVVIDATAPLLERVLDWCESVHPAENDEFETDEALIAETTGWYGMVQPNATKPKKTILFDTVNNEYYLVIAMLLSKYGYRIIDRGSIDSKKAYLYPRLIYRETSYDTISLLHALMTRGLADPTRCCVMIDSSRTAQELKYIHEAYESKHLYKTSRKIQRENTALTNEQGEIQDSIQDSSLEDSVQDALQEAEKEEQEELMPGQLPLGRTSFTTICRAVIYDDLLRQVRIWVRMGYTAKEIQGELDARFATIYQIHDDIEEDIERKEAEAK